MALAPMAKRPQIQKGQIIKPFIYQPPNVPLSILHLDDDIIIVDKPSGLLSVPGKAVAHKDCLESRLRAQYPELRLVHRLDHPTSGIMVFARNAHAQRHLGLQFEKRHIRKVYQARVSGVVQGDSGHINLPLICDWPNRPKQMVCFNNGKSSQTDWMVLDREGYTTRLHLFPKTGRSHQLRVHCLAIGHPILGDSFYGCYDSQTAAQRLQLHSETISLRHPSGGAWLEFSAPCPF